MEVGSNTVTLTVTDNNGNATVCTSAVTIEDNVAPVAVCQDLTVQLDVNGTASITAGDVDNGSSDACGIASLSIDNGTFTCLEVGSNTVTLTVTDNNGNATTCSSTLTVKDNLAPTGPLPAPISGIDDCKPTQLAAEAAFDEAYAVSTYNDNCSMILSAVLTNTEVLGNHCDWQVNYTYTVMDGNGNGLPSQVYSVEGGDNSDPILTPPSEPVTLNVGAGVNCQTIIPDLSGNILVDECSSVTFTQTPAIGTQVFGIGSPITVDITVEDECGNSSMTSFTLNFVDETAPTALCQDVTVNLDAAGNATIAPATVDNGSNDHCSPVTLSIDVDQFDCGNIGANTVILTATDGSGNASTCSSSVTIQDLIAPVVNCPGDITVNRGVNCSANMPDVTGLVTIDEACGIASVTQSINAGSVINVSTTSLVQMVTVTDVNGNVGQCSLTVYFVDLTPPVITSCPADVTVYTAPGLCSNVVTWSEPTATDNCTQLGPITWKKSHLSGATFNEGTTTVKDTAVDASGNIAICAFNVTVLDGEDPATPVLAEVTVDCNGALIVPTTTDNCVGTVTGTTGDVLSFVEGSSTIITWTFDDGHGNSTSATQVYYYDDLTAPDPDVATLPDVTVECEVTSLTAPTATDNCSGTVTVMNDATLPITTQGTTVVTWTYDDGNGNTSTQLQNVVINDLTPPVPDVATLPDVNAECEVTSLTPPTATENCVGTVTVTNNATLPISGTTVVTWTYDDGNGNMSMQTQNVVINDVTAPVPDLATLPDVTAECEVTSLTAPSATDNCGGTVTVTNDATLPITTQGTTVVTWTYEDGNGNTSTQPQNVVINDMTAPDPDVATLPDVTAECEVTSLTAPTATDNCGGTVTVTNDATLPITTQGTTVVTWTYEDGNGNTSTQTQNAVINDVTAPVPDVVTLPLLSGTCSVDVVTIPTATDICQGTISGTTVDPLTYSTPGNYTINWTYNDGNGNTVSQTQDVEVLGDTEGPVFTCPADITAVALGAPTCAQNVVINKPTITDNCDAGINTGDYVISTNDPEVVLNDGGGSWSALFPIGETVVTLTAMDVSGNVTTCMFTVTIEENLSPMADFTYVVSQGDVTFTNMSANAVSYLWDFGDGNTSTVNNPIHTYAAIGTYTVCLIATSACGTVDELCAVDVEITEVASGPADLTPSFFFPINTLFSSGQGQDVILKIQEVAGNSSTGTIQFFVPFISGFTMTFDNMQTTANTLFGPQPVDNANWSITSLGTGLLFESSQTILANQTSNIAIHLTANTSFVNGLIKITIGNGSGGEVITTNNKTNLAIGSN